MRSLGVGERRARVGVRQRLAVKGRGVVEVARDLVALHATDPATVHLSALARMEAGKVGDVESALYDERSLVRLLGMRRTMFVVPTELVPVIQASSTAAVLAAEWRKAVKFVEEGGLADDGERWLGEVQEGTVAALRARGQATAQELSADVPGLREQIVVARGTRNEAPMRMSTRVLFLLAAAGRIVRGRPTGSWISSQYRWAPAETWLPDGVPDLPVAQAQAELVRRWLKAFGPATVDDVQWWTGWGARDTRRALQATGAVEVDLDGVTGLLLADDLDPVPVPDPWVALLPALDPTPMGWKHRDWYLGAHKARLFDNTGNVGPTVWSEGRIVGGWAQRKDGEVAFRLLEDVGADVQHAVEDAAHDLARVLGDIRVTPRFRTPLERELTA